MITAGGQVPSFSARAIGSRRVKRSRNECTTFRRKANRLRLGSTVAHHQAIDHKLDCRGDGTIGKGGKGEGGGDGISGRVQKSKSKRLSERRTTPQTYQQAGSRVAIDGPEWTGRARKMVGVMPR